MQCNSGLHREWMSLGIDGFHKLAKKSISHSELVTYLQVIVPTYLRTRYGTHLESSDSVLTRDAKLGVLLTAIQLVARRAFVSPPLLAQLAQPCRALLVEARLRHSNPTLFLLLSTTWLKS